MYKEFYKLNKNPFSFIADPLFTFETKSFIKGYHCIIYGIEKMEGIVFVTGEIGTGKTTLCNFIIDRIKQDNQGNSCVILSDPLFLSNRVENIYKLLASELPFSLKEEKNDVKKLSSPYDAFRKMLTKLSKKGKKVILIIDEADKLSAEMLRDISLLSNMETEYKKLIQIVLIGEPSLNDTLQQPELKQLNQRITVKHKLKNLTLRETRDYIHHRLKIAGDNGAIRFTPRAVKKIYKYTEGCQRLVNLICDRALLRGSMENTILIDDSIIQIAIKSVNPDEMSPVLNIFNLRHAYLVGAAITAFLTIGIWGYKYNKKPDNGKSVVSAGLPVETEPKPGGNHLTSNIKQPVLNIRQPAAGIKQPAPQYVVVTVSLARIRKYPNLESDTLNLVRLGTILNKKGINGNWTKVQLPEKDGYGWIGNSIVKNIDLLKKENHSFN